jgi:hypothetical protein
VNPVERLARAERDAVDLHKALAEALHRMARARTQIDAHALALEAVDAELVSADLALVLDRTSRGGV